MKNDTDDAVEKQILLRESGELSPAAAAELDALLAKDSALQAYADDAKALQAASQVALPVDGPPASVMQGILDQAAALDVDPKPLPLARRVVQVMSYAAALVLAFGLWQFNLDVQRTGRISEVSAMLTLTGDESGVLASDVGVDDLEDLAELLLEMEGFAQDDDGMFSDDSFMPPVEHPPTAIQGRSNRASLERKYG